MLSNQLERSWSRQQAAVARLIADPENFAHGLPGLETAFQIPRVPPVLGCIDEGVVGANLVHLAGSGILVDFPTAAAIARSAGVAGVTTHQDCGAAVMAARAAGIAPSQVEEFAKNWGEKLAQELGVPFRGHIPITQMRRPAGAHDATVAYYSGTPIFNAITVEGLPKGFHISRAAVGQKIAIDEAKIAADIAAGHHGFGEKFTPATPFVLVPIADPRKSDLSLQKLTAELEPVAAKFSGRVIVRGFTAPR